MPGNLFLFAVLMISSLLQAETYSGCIRSKSSNKPLGYVNIGVVDKNTGTVSDANGAFQLSLDKQSDNDILRISCIGYDTLNFRVSEFIKMKKRDIFLAERDYSLKEAVVTPKRYKEKVLGVKSKSRSFAIGFCDAYSPGYEMGMILPVKKTARLKKINFNILSCSYDTIFCRVNIYELKGNDLSTPVNVLQKPLYLSVPKAKIKNTVTLDVEALDLCVSGNCLVTLESVKDLGVGRLLFHGDMLHKTYRRLTSQGYWKSLPMGFSMNVLADVEY